MYTSNTVCSNPPRYVYSVWYSGVTILGLARWRVHTKLSSEPSFFLCLIQWRSYSKLQSEQVKMQTGVVLRNLFPYCLPNRIPVQTIFEAHPSGCAAIAMSPDAKYIATISSTLPQVWVEFCLLWLSDWQQTSPLFWMLVSIRQVMRRKGIKHLVGRLYQE